MTTAHFEKRQIFLRAEAQRERAIALIRNLPLDDKKPLLIEIKMPSIQRGKTHNSFMWAGPLHDLQEQAFIQGRQHSAEVWNEYAKRQFLPEEFDPELCLENYRKWADAPDGGRILVGSTTMLTSKGMALYLEQLIAFGASLGVQFNERSPT
jgi:hypothetical protein